jgi:hypothetical protein
MKRPLLTIIGILLNCLGLWFLSNSIVHQTMSAFLLINAGILLMIAGSHPGRGE